MCGLIFIQGKSVKEDDVKESLDRIAYRGPDFTSLTNITSGIWMGFNRLSIMDLSPKGNQPFIHSQRYVVCNGEIYNFNGLRSKLHPEYQFTSSSDCEVLLPLLTSYSVKDACNQLSGEFAFVSYDFETKSLTAARDPIGIRPLFFGYSVDNEICFASEAKSLQNICNDIKPFPPGHYYEKGQFKSFHDFRNIIPSKSFDEEREISGIKYYLEQAVERRLQSDAPVGYLLSGGLDSSLVCSIAAKKSKKPITTFAVGIEDSAIDTKYARVVADYLGSIHHEVLFTKEDIFQTLPELIYRLETWDITTIRAAMGMYILCKYIKKNTDIKVVLTGEVSDELFGYKYTDYAPCPESFQEESYKRVEELYMYDVLRADRCISANSLEARVPFSDTDFVNHVLQIEAKSKMNRWGMGKFLLRKAFDDGKYLPKDILYREKAAFSDAVGHTVVDYLKEHAKKKYSDLELQISMNKYPYCPPISKESLLYREIFESFYPGRADLIKDFWMPNRDWKNCDVRDPSARLLPNYGLSGS